MVIVEYMGEKKNLFLSIGLVLIYCDFYFYFNGLILICLKLLILVYGMIIYKKEKNEELRGVF